MSASPINLALVPSSRVPLVMPDSDLVSTEWYRFFVRLIADVYGGGAIDADLAATAPAAVYVNSSTVTLQETAPAPLHDSILI